MTNVTTDRLQKFMNTNNLSRKDLAAALGYDVVHLHKVFCGASSITERFIGKFFLVYGPDATTAVFGDDETPEVLPCSEATA